MTEAIITPQKKKLRCNAHSDTKVEKLAGAHQKKAPPQTNDGERYIVITYAVRPENPDWHREQFFVFYKGTKSDDAMRTYVAAHIKLT